MQVLCAAVCPKLNIMVRTERVTVISVRVRTSLKAEADFMANVDNTVTPGRSVALAFWFAHNYYGTSGTAGRHNCGVTCWSDFQADAGLGVGGHIGVSHWRPLPWCLVHCVFRCKNCLTWRDCDLVEEAAEKVHFTRSIGRGFCSIMVIMDDMNQI